MHWSVPGLTFVILVAVGADYNMLLISRIRDESPHGVRSGIIRTVGSTGGVITAAGLIMAASMFGLLFSSLSSVVQGGFVLGTGLLLDTFLVRTITVPAIAVLVGKANWWPSGLSGRLGGGSGIGTGGRRAGAAAAPRSAGGHCCPRAMKSRRAFRSDDRRDRLLAVRRAAALGLSDALSGHRHHRRRDRRGRDTLLGLFRAAVDRGAVWGSWSLKALLLALGQQTGDLRQETLAARARGRGQAGRGFDDGGGALRL